MAGILDSTGQHAKLQKYLEINTRVAMTVAVLGAGGLAFLGGPVIAAWLGPDLSPGRGTLLTLGALLPVATLVNAATRSVCGVGRHHRQALILTAEMLLNLGISVALAPRLGVLGVALGTLISRTLVTWPYLVDGARQLRLQLGRLVALAVVPNAFLAVALFVAWTLIAPGDVMPLGMLFAYIGGYSVVCVVVLVVMAPAQLRRRGIEALSRLLWGSVGAAARGGPRGMTARGEKAPRISAVITTYNRADLVRRAIDSALAQDAADFEVIVVDDGSTDGTREALAGYGDGIRYVWTENSGAGASRNTGLGLARGEYVAFLDSDDEWRPQALSSMAAALDRFGEEYGACFADCIAMGDPSRTRSFFEETGFGPGPGASRIEDAIACVMRPKMPMLIIAMMFRRSLLERIGGLDPGLRVAQDTDLFFRAALAAKMCAVNRVLARFDVTPSRGVSQLKVVRGDPMVRIAAEVRLYTKLLAALGDDRAAEKAQVRERLSSALSRKASQHVRRREKREAREAIRRAAGYRVTPRVLAKMALCYTVPGLFASALSGRDGR